MGNRSSTAQNKALPLILVAILAGFVGLAYFAGHYKILTIAAAAVCIWLLLSRDLTPLRTIPALLLTAYVVIAGLSRFWALSGKFFLQEYTELFVAFVLFLAVILSEDFDRNYLRKVMFILSAAAALLSILSVEAATTGVLFDVLKIFLPSFSQANAGFEAGTRLTGILSNANILSTVLGLAILCSIGLLSTEEDGKLRLIHAGILAINAFTFLLLFSMGGMVSFAAAVLVYLLFAGKQRGSALIRMLEGALPTLIWVFVAFPFFNREGAVILIPLAALIGNVLCVVALEKLLAPKLSAALAAKGKMVLALVSVVIALVAVYAVLGMTLTGAHTFDGSGLRRSAYPAAGSHTLSVEASGDVKVNIISQNMSQVMMHTNTVIYSGPAADAAFTVPEDSEVCYFTFTASSGTILESAQLEDGTALKLNYTLLPGFIANRLQGLLANQNAIQRTVFFDDGMKIFADSPLLGSGMGCFGTAITGVQQFYYETKYVHNHYIQVLLEVGLLGFIPFVGALLTMAFLLWKRRKDEQWAFIMESPVLWAGLVMLLIHMVIEVSMSIIIPLSYAFILFALIIRSCTGSAAQKEISLKNSRLFRMALLALTAVFAVTLVMNTAVNAMYRQSANSIDHFMNRLELSSKLDVYEGNDAKLSYLQLVYQEKLADYLPQADIFADELMEVHSNSIPVNLVVYYLSTRQYDKALEAAQMGTIYSSSDASTWNSTIAYLRYLMFGPGGSPLLVEDECDLLMDGALNYYHTLQQRNANSMDTIALSVNSRDFFSRLLYVEEGERDKGMILGAIETMFFDLQIGSDADLNGIHDQISNHSGAQFNGETVSLAERGWVELEVREGEEGTQAQLVVSCDDPSSIYVYDSTDTLREVLPTSAKNGKAVFHLTMNQGDGATLRLQVNSLSPQEIHSITLTKDM